MPIKSTHKRPTKDTDRSIESVKKIVVKSHIRSVRPNVIKKDIEPAISIPSIEKHVDKPVIKRQRKPGQSAVSLNDSIKDIAKRSSTTKQEDTRLLDSMNTAVGGKRRTKTDNEPTTDNTNDQINESVKESPYPIHSISKLVLSAMIHILKGNLNASFKLGNLSCTCDEILHHSSGIIDGVDKRLYSKYDHINKPIGVYSNEAFNFLAKNLKSVIGMTYKQGLNELNNRLGTHFTSNGIAEEIGAYDLSSTTDDLTKLGEYVNTNYEWFANGTVKRPGRGIDIITPSVISKLGSMKERGSDVKLTITKKKITVERDTNLQWTDQKYIVQQRIPKTKFIIDIDNRHVTEPVISQPLNLPVECIADPSSLTEIDGSYWKLVKTTGKTKYYQSPISNSRRPFLVVTD